MTTIWHNGRYTDDGPVFRPADRLRLGDGVFDTMMAVDGRPVHAGRHFARLLAHAQAMRIPADIGIAALESAARELLDRNKYRSGRYVINTILSRGPAERGLRPPESPAVQIVMTASPAPSEFPPVSAIIAQRVRRNEGSPLSRIKSCNYGDNIMALAEAQERSANEAIMLNNAGNVACASASNIFIAVDGQLWTPPLRDGAMAGITREIVMEKYGAQEKTIGPDELARSEGVYVTNCVRGAAPVEILNGKRLRPPALEIDKDLHLK
jgi:branched-subunit amino acid aminotransferase/4-amino-4-deoxychorismate lyase